MPKFKLPFAIYGEPMTKRFVNVFADTISAAAAKAEEFLRKKHSTPLKRACVIVGEIDYSSRYDNGQPMPQPQPRRRGRNFWRRRW